MSTKKLMSLGQLYKASYQAVRRNLAIFITLNIFTILSVAWTMGLDLRDKANGNDWGEILTRPFTGGGDFSTLNSGLQMVLFIGTIVFYVLTMILTVKAAQQNVVSFNSVWETFKSKWWRVLLVLLITFVLIGAGLLLLVIPGLFLLARLSLSPIIAIDQDIGVVEAIDKSWQMTKGYGWIIFITVLFEVLLSLPSVIPVFGQLISVVLTIAYSVALPLRYFELKKQKA